MTRSAINVEDFSFRYRNAKRYAVRHLSFEVDPGTFFCVVGSNDSGKSTLCNALVGLIPHHFKGHAQGTVEVHGSDVSKTTIAALSTEVGFVFQNPFNQLSYTAGTVAEELAYGLCNRGVPRDEMIERVERIAEYIHLEGLLDRNPLELSGGQIQRVAIGSTLVMDPSVLVLDECTTQLDPLGSEEVFDIIKRLNETGMTVVMVDHNMERVARCADTVLALERGNQVALGSPREVLANGDIEDHGVAVPDFARITRALNERQLVTCRIELTEDPTVEHVREALDR